MADNRLAEYINREYSKGIPIIQIKQALLRVKWPENKIDEALAPFQLNELKKRYVVKKSLKSVFFMMGTILILIVGIVYIYFFNPFGTDSKTENFAAPPLNLADCKEDFDCFISASSSCAPSKVKWTSNIVAFGMTSSSTKMLELRGIEGGKCIYNERVESTNVKFNEDMINQMTNSGSTMEMIGQQEIQANESAKAGIGVEMDCKFNLEGLSEKFARWKEGNVNMSTSCNPLECVYNGDYEGCILKNN